MGARRKYSRGRQSLSLFLLHCRLIMVRRCISVDATVWSQELQSCVSPGSFRPQVQPPRNGSIVVSDGGHHYHHHHYPILGHKHYGGAGLAAGRNPCRHRGPPFYRPHPTSPSMYIQCSTTGRAFFRKCPRGLRWNQRATTCDRSAPGSLYHLQSS